MSVLRGSCWEDSGKHRLHHGSVPWYRGPGCSEIDITKYMAVNKVFQAWQLIGWQHSRQPIRSQVRNSMLTKMDFNMNFLGNPLGWAEPGHQQPWYWPGLSRTLHTTHRKGGNCNKLIEKVMYKIWLMIMYNGRWLQTLSTDKNFIHQVHWWKNANKTLSLQSITNKL